MPKLRINLTNLTNPTTPANTNVTLPHYGLEEQFILRLPPSLASILSSELAENEYTSPGDLSIKFVSGRTAIVKHPRFIKDAYPAVLMDSPTIMETLKNSTLSISEISRSEDKEVEDNNPDTGIQDGKSSNNLGSNHQESEMNVGQYYKVADLNQILMVLDLDTQEGQRIFNRVPQPLQEHLLKSLANHPVNSVPVGLDDITASWAQFPDGLTPPMKAAQSKKFAPRPLHAATVGDLERIERELERLLKSDGQAIESKFSLIGSNGEILLGDSDFMAIGGEDIQMIDEEEEEIDNEDNEEIEYSEDSSASDIEDMNDFAAEIEDNLLTFQPETANEAEAEQTLAQVQEKEKDNESSISPAAESETDRLVKDLEAKLAEKLKQAESVSNPLIKARIEDVIRQLEDNLKNLRERE